MGNALRHVRGESQKNIVRFIEGLSGKYSRWDIWQDFIIMSAIAIANTMGGPQAKAREEMYRSRAEKYSAKELEVFADMLLEVVAELERDPEQDFLGELFMALGLGNEWKGQFFTPYSVCRAMSAMTYAPDMTARIEKQGWVSVNDPACGAGALLLAFANECRRQHINYQTSVLFVAQDIDFLAGCMCYIQLSLLGCPGYVVIDDSLLRPSVSYDARGLLPKDGPQVWYESISGQYQLWDEAAKVVATSAGSINSALESQITYWQDYNANLQSLTDRSTDIEGLSDMIASFADGSSDSVNAIAGMAGATDEQLATMVANWKTLQQEQQNAAGSVADLKTDFTATMDELQTALAEDIEAMDLGDEAKASAQATIQGFIDGAVGMLPQVTAAYNRVAAAARAALSASGTGTASSIPGYAVGTQSAAPGFALVGENGPELVYFNGGEQVMTAEETAAMRESMEIQAITFAPQLLEALHAIHGDGALSAEPGAGSGAGSVELQIVFQINGGASPETVEALREYGDEFAERVLEVMEEAGIDTARRAYK